MKKTLKAFGFLVLALLLPAVGQAIYVLPEAMTIYPDNFIGPLPLNACKSSSCADQAASTASPEQQSLDSGLNSTDANSYIDNISKDEPNTVKGDDGKWYIFDDKGTLTLQGVEDPYGDTARGVAPSSSLPIACGTTISCDIEGAKAKLPAKAAAVAESKAAEAKEASQKAAEATAKNDQAAAEKAKQTAEEAAKAAKKAADLALNYSKTYGDPAAAEAAKKAIATADTAIETVRKSQVLNAKKDTGEDGGIEAASNDVSRGDVQKTASAGDNKQAGGKGTDGNGIVDAGEGAPAPKQPDTSNGQPGKIADAVDEGTDFSNFVVKNDGPNLDRFYEAAAALKTGTPSGPKAVADLIIINQQKNKDLEKIFDNSSPNKQADPVDAKPAKEFFY